MFSQLRGIGYLDYLIQSVFNNRVGQTCGDIRYLSAFLLGLFHFGVHEYRTSGSEVNGILGKKCGFCKILYAVVQGICKCFDKRTAAG